MIDSAASGQCAPTSHSSHIGAWSSQQGVQRKSRIGFCIPRIRADEGVPDVKRNASPESCDFLVELGRVGPRVPCRSRDLFFTDGGGIIIRVQRITRAVYDKAKMASSYAAGK